MLSVLLVDDDALLRETIADALAAAGMAVSEADNGATALAMVEAGGFDIVICDLFMPGVDGLELLVGMQRADLRTPVIVMTGGANAVPGRSEQVTTSCLAAARTLGAASTLRKPVLPSEIIHAIEALTGASSSGSDAGQALRTR